MTSGAGGELQKPSSDEYQLSVLSALGFESDFAKAETTYEFNMRAARSSTQTGSFLELVSALREIPSSYLNGRPELLFYPAAIEDDLALRTKPFSSVVGKLYRRNVLYNRRWPAPPKGGWLEPTELYENIDDLLRTRLVCRYLDGPKFVCERLALACSHLGVEHNIRTLSTDAGYYAWHFYFRMDVELALGANIESRLMWVEIQLTTQLAEVITALTHGLYEQRREGAGNGDDWKWEPASPEFRSSFIGHGLHLLEGVIQTFRDDVLPSGSSSAANPLPEDDNTEAAKAE